MVGPEHEIGARLALPSSVQRDLLLLLPGYESLRSKSTSLKNFWARKLLSGTTLDSMGVIMIIIICIVASLEVDESVFLWKRRNDA